MTLYANTASGSASEKVALSAGNPQQERFGKMLAFIKKNGRITNREYQELCPDVNPETLRRDFVDMVERGAILRIGDKRGTYYILK